MNYFTALASLAVIGVATSQHSVSPGYYYFLSDFDTDTTVYIYPDKTNFLDYYDFVSAPVSDYDTAKGLCEWDINMTSPLQIINETDVGYDDFYTVNTHIEDMFENIDSEQGKFIMRTDYRMYHRHYSIELFKKDCHTPMSGHPFFSPIVVNNVDNSTGINEFSAYFFYLQKSVQESDIWTATKTGGIVEFCLRVNNFLAEEKTDDQDDVFDEWGVPISFNETVYTITVDSLTDFETSIDIFRTGPQEGEDFIDYEEDIDAYTCNDYYHPVSLTYTQGDYVNICVETVPGSRFEVHSIKDLTVCQANNTDDTVLLAYDYVADFVDSPLAHSSCMDSNTTSAVCKSKVQLIAGYFVQDNIDAAMGELDVMGTVKLDYLGRRLTKDIPLKLRLGGGDAGSEKTSRALEETDNSFEMTIDIKAPENEDDSSGFFSRDMIFTTTMSLIVSFAFLL